MIFNRHSELIGLHAFLGASKYHWINYDESKLGESYIKFLASARGTRLHEFADEAIKLGVRLPKTKQTLNMYVNDAIGFKMDTEQVLFYSNNCFGTVDAISFKKNFLRIHDLKTGLAPTSVSQLLIYTALFCLEYDVNPNTIEIELRIYQNDDVEMFDPSREELLYIMEKIVAYDKIIDKLKMEEG